MIPRLLLLPLAGIVLFLTLNVQGKPVAPSKPVEGASKDEEVNTGLEYDRYLREVVSVLEEDDEFRKKLESANVTEIKDGSIAKNLEFVGNHIRTKLDEIKRREIERLQELARLKIRTMKGATKDFRRPGHVDVMNPHSFEMKDLEHLIKKTTNDLEELDKQRREEFKEYEMEKQYEQKDKLDHMQEEEKKKEEHRIEEVKKKHGQHGKVNHPASKDQFEEVWENQDHLDKEDFDPKTFFNLHDTNTDGIWNINEVEALLQVELDKVYGEKDREEDDPVERNEEMNRMREHIFTEIDGDGNLLISQEEFMAYTGPKGDKPDFEQNEEWKTLDQEQLFSDEEYNDYISRHHAQPGVVNMPHDPNMQVPNPNVQNMQVPNPNVQNMQIPPGSPQEQLHYQQQLAAQQQQQMHAAQQQQQAVLQQQQMAQQHAAQQQAMAQQQFAAAQQQLHQQQQGVPVQQQGLHGQPQQQGLRGQAQQQPTVVKGQDPVQQQQQHQQQQVPVQQQHQQQQVPVQQQHQQQQQVPVQQQQQVPVQQQQQQQQQVPVQQQQQQQQQVPVQQQQAGVPVQHAQPVVNQV